MKNFTTGNWGLRILALVLAIIVYKTLKNESSQPTIDHDRTLFKSR